jgi:flagellar secretion chaperone FliS
MSQNPYENSLEVNLFASTPMELVVMLYDAALESVGNARRHLAEGQIAERSRAISRAVETLTELSSSLNHSAGGDLSEKLAALYDYMQRALLDANFHQTDAGLEETERLLGELREAWAQAAKQEPAAAAAAAPIPEPTAASASDDPGWDEPVPAGYGLRHWSA